jgi:hypothetical protein
MRLEVLSHCANDYEPAKLPGPRASRRWRSTQLFDRGLAATSPGSDFRTRRHWLTRNRRKLRRSESEKQVSTVRIGTISGWSTA